MQKASTAKENTDNAQIKERIRLSYNSALTKDISNNKGEVEKSTFEEELKAEFPGKAISIEKSANKKEWVVKIDEVTENVPIGKDANNEEEDVVVGSTASELVTADKMHVGNYVNYPVYYDNVYTDNNNSGYKADNTIYASKWRILSIDTTTNEVTLISAGVPIRYNPALTSGNPWIKSAENLKDNFFGIEFGTVGGTFRDDSGFKTTLSETAYLNSTESIKSLFENNYTKTKEAGESIVPDVSAMTKEYIDEVFGTTSSSTSIAANDLLAVPCDNNNLENYSQIWLASVGNNNNKLWSIDQTGNMKAVTNLNQTFGVRPVVTIKSTVTYTEGTSINTTTTWDLH